MYCRQTKVSRIAVKSPKKVPETHSSKRNRANLCVQQRRTREALFARFCVAIASVRTLRQALGALRRAVVRLRSLFEAKPRNVFDERKTLVRGAMCEKGRRRVCWCAVPRLRLCFCCADSGGLSAPWIFLGNENDVTYGRVVT